MNLANQTADVDEGESLSIILTQPFFFYGQAETTVYVSHHALVSRILVIKLITCPELQLTG